MLRLWFGLITDLNKKKRKLQLTVARKPADVKFSSSVGVVVVSKDTFGVLKEGWFIRVRLLIPVDRRFCKEAAVGESWHIACHHWVSVWAFEQTHGVKPTALMVLRLFVSPLDLWCCITAPNQHRRNPTDGAFVSRGDRRYWWGRLSWLCVQTQHNPRVDFRMDKLNL